MRNPLKGFILLSLALAFGYGCNKDKNEPAAKTTTPQSLKDCYIRCDVDGKHYSLYLKWNDKDTVRADSGHAGLLTGLDTAQVMPGIYRLCETALLDDSTIIGIYLTNLPAYTDDKDFLSHSFLKGSYALADTAPPGPHPAVKAGIFMSPTATATTAISEPHNPSVIFDSRYATQSGGTLTITSEEILPNFISWPWVKYIGGTFSGVIANAADPSRKRVVTNGQFFLAVTRSVP